MLAVLVSASDPGAKPAADPPDHEAPPKICKDLQTNAEKGDSPVTLLIADETTRELCMSCLDRASSSSPRRSPTRRWRPSTSSGRR